MSTSRSVSPARKTDEKDEKEKEKRFLNGWSKEQEQLMAEWSDISLCYRWLHDNAEKIYHGKNLWINLPVIILTTLGGTASFGVQSVFSDPVSKQYASFAIGSISLFAGILTTVGNYLRYAQLEESNRVASIAWGKFQRLIAIELAMNPNERIDAIDFLKICRADLDRLIEQSPPIPKEAIAVFEHKFGHVKELKKPDICGSLEHTSVFNSSETRLKQVAVDAAMLMKQRRRTLNELLSPQIQDTIQQKVDERLKTALKSKEAEEKRVESRLESRRESMSTRESVRNRILARPNIHRKEFHAIVVKASEDKAIEDKESSVIDLQESQENVIVIPELPINPLYSPDTVLSPKPDTDDHPLIASID
jgi:hypothetical protein